MSRAGLLARRSAAHRGLLVLVALLVATVTAALGTTIGTVRVAEARIVHDGLTRGGEPGVVQVVTRLAPEADAQDAALRRDVDALFPGVPYDLAREEVPDDDSDAPFVRWTLTPDVAATGAADLRVVTTGQAALRDTVLEDDAVQVRGAEVTGDLGERAADATAALGAASAVALVPMLVLALAGLIAVAQLARLLAATRAGEVRLLVSRGASPAQLTGAAAAEAGIVAAAGAVVGLGTALAVLAARGAPTGALAGDLVPATVVAAAAAVLVLVVVEGLQARATAALRLSDASGRARQAATWGTVALVLVAAAVSLWLLRRYGSPLVPTPDGGQTDPAAAAAPALVLAAAAVLAVALLGPLSRAWAALAARRPDARVLPARQVARRLAVSAVPVVLVVVAAGSVVLAAAYTGTGQRLRHDAAAVASGGDVRVVAAQGSPGPAAQYAELPGAASAAPARVTEGNLDDVTLSVTGVPAARLGRVALDTAGSGDLDRLAAALAVPDLYDGNPRLPAGTTGLTLRGSGQFFVVDPAVEEDAGALGAPASWRSLRERTAGDPAGRGLLETLERGSMPVRLWLADADGQLRAADVGSLDVDLDGDGDGAHPIGPVERSFTMRADVPPAPDGPDGTPGEWTVVAFDVLQVGSGNDTTVLRLSVAEVDATTADGTTSAVDVEDVGWAPATQDAAARSAFDARPGLGLSLAARVENEPFPSPYRIIAAGAGREAVPAVLSRRLAGLLDVRVGERTELPVEGGDRLAVEVVGVVDVVPGARRPAAALVGLAELQAASLRLTTTPPDAGEVWVRAEPGATAADVAGLAAAAARSARSASSGDVQVTTSHGGGSSDATGPVRQAFVVAALAAVLLALVGVGAVSLAAVRGRRGEVAVLRAVGMPPRAQGNGRALELVTVTAAALVVGIAAGWGLAAATAPGLATATLTGFAVVPPALTTLEPWATLVPGLVLLAGLAAVALAVRAGVAAQARDGAYREEVR
ncbi:FtsX-like permease family protein [Isoptericola sp. NPDC057653]|uniref:FtsX-like permease family protein n=1 Tax=Isoptericola sp. NPDC057653 TaxID=3346195 RepID=UPI00369B0963